MFCSLGAVIVKAYNRGKAWVITVPETPGMQGSIERKKLTKGEYRRKSESVEGENERIICSDQAAFLSKKGPVWLIGQSTGWNLVAPSKQDAPKLYDVKHRKTGEPAETASEDLFARMLVADPLCLERAIEGNDFGDFVNSKNEKEPWMVRIAGMVMIFGLCTLATLGAVIWLAQKFAHHGA